MLRDEKMSELGVLIDWWFPPRLKLMLLIVVSLQLFANTEFVRGNPVSAGNEKLQCVTDYLFTINCSLNIPQNTSDSNSAFWLIVMERAQKNEFICMLTETGGRYFCTLQISTPDPDYDYQPNGFIETHTYQFSLCHKLDGAESCELLTDKFKPYKNIKPNAPCCLNLSHESGEHHFTWESTYEKYSWYTTLTDDLMFQLHYYKRGHKLDIPPNTITISSRTNYSIKDHHFSPDTEYCARVRSSPDQAYFEGQWSSWSSEIQWRTDPAVSDPGSDTIMSKFWVKVFIPLAVVVLLTLLLCYAPIKKWRQRSYIPTPAPYFHTLYHDCQGDFKVS
ncbi:interleukin-21 receptor-like isoform X1 [Cheilinus undulatus]|uniref:interleukin-21 receptor-like isoform X1 n=1 Tax=Cheilinus undulatus TaxID=241271 RepID=UPI001BD64993|nr:interleukin-21 receptor-like isoform X1 [Cheilinus undulatus]